MLLDDLICCDIKVDLNKDDKDSAEISLSYSEFWRQFFNWWTKLHPEAYSESSIDEPIPSVSAEIEYVPIGHSPEIIRATVMFQAEEIVAKAILYNNSVIKKKFPHIFDSQASSLVFKKTDKKQWEKKFKAWDKALSIYDLYHSQAGKKSYTDIARKMEEEANFKGLWWKENVSAAERSNFSNKVKRYVGLANRLIEASGQGKFNEEAAKPLPKNY